MNSFLNSQSLLLLLRFGERVQSAKLQFQHSVNEWVRQHIVDDDPYDSAEWDKLLSHIYHQG